MAMESNKSRARREEMESPSSGRAYQRREERVVHGPRLSTKLTYKGVLEELASARAAVQALESRPRARCRVSQVQTTLGCLITAADEMLGLLLQRPARGFHGMPLSSLIAGPERRIFGERARELMEGPEGAEWETRLLAPGARVGVPVAITLERGTEGGLNWYIRDLTDLRRAQARVMQLEQVASAL